MEGWSAFDQTYVPDPGTVNLTAAGRSESVRRASRIMKPWPRPWFRAMWRSPSRG